MVVGDGDNDGIVVGMSVGSDDSSCNTRSSFSNRTSKVVGTGDGGADVTEGEAEGTSDDCSSSAALGITN